MGRVRVASIDELPVGRGKTVEVAGREIALFNAGEGRFHATSGACPHEGGPLGEGLFDRGVIVCPWHGFDFDPVSGTCRVDPELSVRVYQVIIDGTDLFLDLP